MKKVDIQAKHIIKQEYYHTTPKGHRCKVYVCNCLSNDCNNDIKIWSNASRHNGLCGRCVDKNARRAPYTYLYSAFLNSQKHRCITVDLTFQEFVALCGIDRCHYCGNPTIRDKHRQKIQSNAYMIDRKDNFIGYTRDNCVSCCWECNDLKSNRFTYDEFIKLRSFIKTELGR